MLEQVNALYGEMKDFSVSTGISSKIFNADGTELLSCG